MNKPSMNVSDVKDIIKLGAEFLKYPFEWKESDDNEEEDLDENDEDYETDNDPTRDACFLVIKSHYHFCEINIKDNVIVIHVSSQNDHGHVIALLTAPIKTRFAPYMISYVDESSDCIITETDYDVINILQHFCRYYLVVIMNGNQKGKWATLGNAYTFMQLHPCKRKPQVKK